MSEKVYPPGKMTREEHLDLLAAYKESLVNSSSDSDYLNEASRHLDASFDTRTPQGHIALLNLLKLSEKSLET